MFFGLSKGPFVCLLRASVRCNKFAYESGSMSFPRTPNYSSWNVVPRVPYATKTIPVHQKIQIRNRCNLGWRPAGGQKLMRRFKSKPFRLQSIVVPSPVSTLRIWGVRNVDRFHTVGKIGYWQRRRTLVITPRERIVDLESM